METKRIRDIVMLEYCPESGDFHSDPIEITVKSNLERFAFNENETARYVPIALFNSSEEAYNFSVKLREKFPHMDKSYVSKKRLKEFEEGLNDE